MKMVGSATGAHRLLATSILARLPQEMVGVALLLRTEQLTGSFAQAGVVLGTYGIALGAGGPLLGKLIDRRGPTPVLLTSAGIGCVVLLTAAMAPAGLVVLLLLAAAAGVATPPVGACLRAQLPSLLGPCGDIRRTYALEASLVELTYIFGPPLALSIAALSSGAAALALAGVGLLVTTGAFASQPVSRRWRPPTVVRRSAGGVLRPPAMRKLAVILMAVGTLLGADEVAVIAAAKSLHSTADAAPMFAVWGLGSFMGGLVATRLGGGPRSAAGLSLLLGALTVGHLALIPADRSVLALAAALLVAGTAIAPTESSLYALVSQAAPAGAVTEAFACLATAMALGGALGSVGAGALTTTRTSRSFCPRGCRRGARTCSRRAEPAHAPLFPAAGPERPFSQPSPGSRTRPRRHCPSSRTSPARRVPRPAVAADARPK